MKALDNMKFNFKYKLCIFISCGDDLGVLILVRDRKGYLFSTASSRKRFPIFKIVAKRHESNIRDSPRGLFSQLPGHFTMPRDLRRITCGTKVTLL